MKITVILPTYNRREFLSDAIECIVQQEFTDWRLMVINDGGDDVADIVGNFNDKRIEYFNRPHLGKAAQLNFALAQINSKYIAYMDDDDEVFPNHLSLLYNDAEMLNSDFVYSDTWQTVLDADGVEVSRSVENTEDVTRDDLQLYNRINHKQILHTKELSDRVGPYDERLKILIDFDYIKRLMNTAVNPFHVRAITGNHFLRMQEKSTSQNQAAITGLWQRDPVAAGRSLLALFEKDPAALAKLYKLPGQRDITINFLKERLDDRLSARWRKWRHRNDSQPIAPHDKVLAHAEGKAIPLEFTLADETAPSIAAVNRIADGITTNEDIQLINAPIDGKLTSASPNFEVSKLNNGTRYCYHQGKPKRWVMLCSKQKMPTNFVLEFTYLPHTEFKEQLQVDFVMNSLGDRYRFMLRDNRSLVFSRVVNGKFLPDDRSIPLRLALNESAKIRVDVFEDTFAFTVNGKTMISIAVDKQRERTAFLGLVFYHDQANNDIDFEISDIQFHDLTCELAF